MTPSKNRLEVRKGYWIVPKHLKCGLVEACSKCLASSGPKPDVLERAHAKREVLQLELKCRQIGVFSRDKFNSATNYEMKTNEKLKEILVIEAGLLLQKYQMLDRYSKKVEEYLHWKRAGKHSLKWSLTLEKEEFSLKASFQDIAGQPSIKSAWRFVSWLHEVVLNYMTM